MEEVAANSDRVEDVDTHLVEGHQEAESSAVRSLVVVEGHRAAESPVGRSLVAVGSPAVVDCSLGCNPAAAADTELKGKVSAHVAKPAPSTALR